MSILDQFYSKEVPLGSYKIGISNSATLSTPNAEYLREYNYIPYSSKYRALENAFPEFFGYILNPIKTYSNYPKTIQYLNNKYILNASTVSDYPDFRRTSGIAGSPGSSNTAFLTFNNTCIVTGTYTGIYYTTNAISYSTASPSISYTALCNNTTMAVAYNSALTTSSGKICTSTDGRTWTARNPNVTSGSVMANGAVWSPVCNSFIVLSTSTGYYLSANGYTLTNYTMPVGYTALPLNSYSLAIASSQNSTVVLSNNGGTTYRTTNGTSWTSTSLPNTGYYSINCINDRYYLVGNTPGPVLSSADDGVTWDIYDYGFFASKYKYRDFYDTMVQVYSLAIVNNTLYTYSSVGLSYSINTPNLLTPKYLIAKLFESDISYYRLLSGEVIYYRIL